MTQIKLSDIDELAQHAVTFANDVTVAKTGLTCTGLYFDGYRYMARTAVGGDHVGSEIEIPYQIMYTYLVQRLLDICYRDGKETIIPSQTYINAAELLVKAYLFDRDKGIWDMD